MSKPTLYLYPGHENLPSPSPPCTKVFLALKYSQLPHEVEDVKADPRGVSPTGRLPALKLESGETISDSTEILNRLEQMDLPRSFVPDDPRERARDRVWESFANEHLYWRSVYLRWNVPENLKRTSAFFFGKFPLVGRMIVPFVAKREVRRRLQGHGIGKFPIERIRTDFTRALDTYEAGIGAGPFLEERDRPGRADLAAAAHLPQFALCDLTPTAGAELKKRKPLLDYVTRIYQACDLPVPECVAVASAT